MKARSQVSAHNWYTLKSSSHSPVPRPLRDVRTDKGQSPGVPTPIPRLFFLASSLAHLKSKGISEGPEGYQRKLNIKTGLDRWIHMVFFPSSYLSYTGSLSLRALSFIKASRF